MVVEEQLQLVRRSVEVSELQVAVVEVAVSRAWVSVVLACCAWVYAADDGASAVGASDRLFQKFRQRCL